MARSDGHRQHQPDGGDLRNPVESLGGSRTGIVRWIDFAFWWLCQVVHESLAYRRLVATI